MRVGIDHLDKLETASFRHTDIGKNQIRGVIPGQDHGFRYLAGGDYPVTARFKDTARQMMTIDANNLHIRFIAVRPDLAFTMPRKMQAIESFAQFYRLSAPPADN